MTTLADAKQQVGGEPHYSDAAVTLWHGDCLDLLRTLPDCSIDAVVTDPPYGLGFMGHQWDQPGAFGVPRGSTNTAASAGSYDQSAPANARFGQWCQTWVAECFRVLKPGGYFLSFGGTRTYHRLAVAVEDSGFEIRDSIAWLYGSGFPKSLNVATAIDRTLGAVPTVTGQGAPVKRMIPGADQNRTGSWIKDNGREYVPTTTEATTAAARPWQGWGTALKPSFEPIIVGRKPFSGTVAANVLTNGTGALNIDACRVEVSDVAYARNQSGDRGHAGTRSSDRRGDTDIRSGGGSASRGGRWPPNVVIDGSQADELDRQTGTLISGANPTRRNPDKFRNAYGEFQGQEDCTPARGADQGGASRFFPTFRYEAKAPIHERPRDGSTAHPTVKPLNLMRWLVQLVTPPGGTVLDPFAGSGTTAEACVVEGFLCITCEREAAYLPLIVARLSKPIPLDMFGGVA